VGLKTKQSCWLFYLCLVRSKRWTLVVELRSSSENTSPHIHTIRLFSLLIRANRLHRRQLRLPRLLKSKEMFGSVPIHCAQVRRHDSTRRWLDSLTWSIWRDKELLVLVDHTSFSWKCVQTQWIAKYPIPPPFTSTEFNTIPVGRH
jgi:hypothetical protein